MLRVGLTISLVGAAAVATLTSSAPAPPVTTVVMLVERFGLPHNAPTQLVIRKNTGNRPILFVNTRIATPLQLQTALHFAQVQHQRLGDTPAQDVEAVPRSSNATTTKNIADSAQLRRMARYLNALATHDPVVIQGIGRVRTISIAMQSARAPN